MSDPYLDHLPSHEREKIRKRLRSPAEYERLREKVKGPEDLEREMTKNAEFAEAKLALENEPKMREQSKKSVQDYVRENGSEAAFEHSSEALRGAIAQGSFEITIDTAGHEPKIALTIGDQPKSSGEVPSGNVAEVFSLKPALQQQILSSFQMKK